MLKDISEHFQRLICTDLSLWITNGNVCFLRNWREHLQREEQDDGRTILHLMTYFHQTFSAKCWNGREPRCMQQQNFSDMFQNVSHQIWLTLMASVVLELWDEASQSRCTSFSAYSDKLIDTFDPSRRKLGNWVTDPSLWLRNIASSDWILDGSWVMNFNQSD